MIEIHTIMSGSVTSLEDLEAKEFIVKGVIGTNHQTVLQKRTVLDKELIGPGHTVVDFTLTEVYKGDLAVGDVIPLAEPYYIMEDGEICNFIHSRSYMPSEPGKEYLFFFAARTDREPLKDCYIPYDMERYPVIDSLRKSDIRAYTNEELHLGTGDSALYREIYAQVIDKYM